MGWRDIGRICLRFLSSNWLSIAMLTAIILGIILGIILKNIRSYNEREIMYIGFLGELFLQMLKGVAVPLMASCIILAFATLDASVAKLFGIHLAVFVLLTKIIAVILGISMAIICKPGSGDVKKGVDHVSDRPGPNVTRETIDNFLDMIKNVFPENMIDMTMRQSITNITNVNGTVKYNDVMVEGVNMLGIVTFSIVTGLALKTMGSANKPIVDIVLIFGEITFVIVKFIMYIAPVLLVSLVAQQLVLADIQKFLSSIGLYALVASGTLLIHLLVVYPLIIFFLGGTNPFKLYWMFFEAITTSFACCSSMASLPVAMKCLESKMGCDSNLVSFIVPISIAINKDGACINLAVSSIFFAQKDGRDMGVPEYLLVAIFAISTSIASPGVPQGVLLMLVVILESLKLPGNYAGSILAVDLLVDRIVTLLNVTGAAVACAVINNFTKKKRTQLALESGTTPPPSRKSSRSAV